MVPVSVGGFLYRPYVNQDSGFAQTRIGIIQPGVVGRSVKTICLGKVWKLATVRMIKLMELQID